MGLVLDLPLYALGYDVGACLLGALGLPAIVLCFNVSVEGRVGQVPFAAAAEVVSSFLVLPGPSGGGFLEFDVI